MFDYQYYEYINSYQYNELIEKVYKFININKRIKNEYIRKNK